VIIGAVVSITNSETGSHSLLSVEFDTFILQSLYVPSFNVSKLIVIFHVELTDVVELLHDQE
jgi:hypothetical protein